MKRKIHTSRYSGRSFDVIGFGALNIDKFFQVPNTYLQSEQPAYYLDAQPGGAAANTITALSNFGLQTGLMGVVGDDQYSNILYTKMKRSKIDVSHVYKLPQKSCGQSHVFIKPYNKRIIYTQPEVNSEFDKKLINLQYLSDTSWLHMSTFVDEKQLALQEWVTSELAGNVQMSLWVNSQILTFGYIRLQKYLPYIDTLFIKNHELEILTGLEGLDAAYKIIADGCKNVAVIYGPYESLVVSENEHHNVKILQKLPATDVTGISCAFASGYIFGKKHGYSLKQSALAGNVMMSYCVEKIGCQSRLPTIQEFRKRMYIFKPEKNVLVVGGGGREHALSWKLYNSQRVKRVYAAPGNAGIAKVAHIVQIADSDITALKQFVKDKDIDLTVVGPETPLANGIVDAFEKDGLAIFGPSKKAAMLETSKTFAKRFMKKFHIPTAAYKAFTNYQRAVQYIHKIDYPVVIKADGLAAGKGVMICKTEKEANDWLEQIMVKKLFGDAGEKVIIEEFLAGEEASVFAITDGEQIVPLLPVQDHKAIYDGDKGPNTGGMGTYAPAPVITPSLMEEITHTVLEPTIRGMKKIGAEYKGVLFVGIIMTRKGPKVLEYNCRFGDPETQVLMPLLETDLLDIFDASLLGTLGNIRIQWKQESCVCVIAASGGYPGVYQTEKEIQGLQTKENSITDNIFHSGTKQLVISSGGRVFGVTSTGKTLQDAVKKSYKNIRSVSFENMHYRKDIASKAYKHLKTNNKI